MKTPLTITLEQARRFHLLHHGLYPPRQLHGKAGVMDYVKRVGCIQYDTINVLGRNADLVLNARLQNYKPAILEALLYEDRMLWDGFDKVQSIYATADWPHFAKRREVMNLHYQERLKEMGALQMATKIIAEIYENGPLSSIDIEDDSRTQWSWGYDTRTVRACMEAMYAQGILGVHHKINTRRVFDLVENLIPASLYKQDFPHATDEQYHDWHVLRRIGGLGLAHPKSSEKWLGILNVKSKERQAAIERLLAAGKIIAVDVKNLAKQRFYIRSLDLPSMEKAAKKSRRKARAAFIAPLDNALWDRDLLRALYAFNYVWEVYKPAKLRKFGYYVLPVLYGEQFVARLDAKFERQTGKLWLNNWWWEKGVDMDPAMDAALADCVLAFGRYLGAKAIHLGKKSRQKKNLTWMRTFSV